MHADILPSLRVKLVLSATYFFLSNIGLFHVIYKTVNDFMQSKLSHLNEPHQVFLDYESFIFTSKMLVNEFKNKKCSIHV